MDLCQLPFLGVRHAREILLTTMDRIVWHAHFPATLISMTTSVKYAQMGENSTLILIHAGTSRRTQTQNKD